MNIIYNLINWLGKDKELQLNTIIRKQKKKKKRKEREHVFLQ
jgi:hypothetical protein